MRHCDAHPCAGAPHVVLEPQHSPSDTKALSNVRPATSKLVEDATVAPRNAALAAQGGTAVSRYRSGQAIQNPEHLAGNEGGGIDTHTRL